MLNFNLFKRLFKKEEPSEQTVSEQLNEIVPETDDEETPKATTSEFTSAEIIFEESDSEPKIKQIKKQRTYRSESKYR